MLTVQTFPLPRIRGFTLIELLITILVLGILVTVAVPSYMDYVRQARRADAKSVLLEDVQSLERNYSTNNCYNKTSPADCANQTGSNVALPYSQSPKTGTTYYNISLSAVAQSSYTLQAAPTGSMTGDECDTFTITSTGEKGLVIGGSASTDATLIAACWQK